MQNKMARYFGCCTLALLLPWAVSAQGKAKPLQLIVLNMRGADETAVRKEALRETKPTVWPAFRSNPAKPPVFETFEGHFVPAEDSTQLAIFSDDGCTITVDDLTPGKKKGQDIQNPVLKKLSVGQHLPNLAQSFHVLKLTDKKGKKLSWQKGNIYHIRVEYSNIIHTDKKDVDGCTLFAYEGGGKVLPPGTKVAAVDEPGVLMKVCLAPQLEFTRSVSAFIPETRNTFALWTFRRFLLGIAIDCKLLESSSCG